MNEKNQHSDEFISAYIDGELDNDERARLLYDEQEDKMLAQRITEARILKEKVQLAYSDLYTPHIEKKFSGCTALISRKNSLVATFLLAIIATAFLPTSFVNESNIELAKQLIDNSEVITADAINDAIGNRNRIIINVSQYQPQNFTNTINHIESLLIQHSGNDLFKIEIIVNKSGLKALDVNTSAHAKRIVQLAERFDNLEVIACAKSLTKLAENKHPIELIASIEIIPSTARQVAMRTSDGWLYLKV